MNRALPPRDRGDRNADSPWTAGLTGPLFGAGRLVSRAAADRAGTTLRGDRRALGFDFASHPEPTVDAPGPELVGARAETRVFVALEAFASSAKIVRRDVFRLVDRADVPDRLVVALFVFDDQQRQAQVAPAAPDSVGRLHLPAAFASGG